MTLVFRDWAEVESVFAEAFDVPPDLRGVDRMKRRMMTDAEREEIAEIERRKKAEFEEAGRKLFGTGFSAKHPRLK